MKVDFAYRTYNSFGPNATLGIASAWTAKKLKENYGGGIQSLLVEACCRNVSPPKRTLESMHEEFELWISNLPFYELVDDNTELRICYNAIKYTHDEVTRDMQMLSVKAFQQVIGKASQLVADVHNKIKGINSFDAEALSRDLRAAREEAPRTLDELIDRYRETPRKPPNKAL